MLVKLLARLLALVPTFALQAKAGCTFANQYARLQEQMERFDVRSAEITLESDRTAITVSIEATFDGSLDNFNTTVRTRLKYEAMRNLTGQRALIHYTRVLWQTLPILPAVFSVWSTSMNLPFYFRVPTYISGVTQLFCLSPVCVAAAMELGKRCATGKAATGARAVFVYLGIGLLVASLYTVFMVMSRPLPALVGLGRMRRLGVEAWCAVPMAVFVNGLACVAAVWAFQLRLPAEDEVVES